MLIGHWPLNGNTNDYSGYKNNLLVSGSPTIAAGKIGAAYLFDTAGEHAYIPAANNTFQNTLSNNFSISFWYNMNSAAGTNRGILQYGAAGTNTQLHILVRAANNLAFAFYGNDFETTYIPTAGVWTHYTLVGDRTNMKQKLYVNGTFHSERTVLTWLNPPNSIFYIGYYNGYVANGYLNDIRLYNTVLSEYEVKEVAKAKILHYTFDDPYEEPTINYVAGPLNPDNGWGTRIHTTVPVSISDDNLHGYSLYGYKLNNTTDASSWSGNAYSYTAIREHSCTSGKKYTASVWCYVSTDSNIDWARVSSEGAGSGSMMYDMTKKGTWQRLVNTFTASSTAIARSYLYFSMNGVTTFATMTGYIIFAAPQFEEKDHVTPFVDGTRTSTISDCSGFGNKSDPIADATAPQWVSGARVGSGAYLFFNPTTTTNYITKSSFYSTDNITMSVWFKKTGDGLGGFHIPLNIDAGLYEISVGSTGVVRVGFTINGTRRTLDYTSLASVDGNWHMLTGSYDGTTIRSYIDGILVSSTADYPGTLPQALRVVYIGKYSTSTQYAQNGYLDDIRIYATALSDADVKSLYERRANLDNMGNLQISTLDINGIGSDSNILSAYKNQVSGTYTGALKYYRDYSAGTDSDRGTINYVAAPPEYNLVIGRYPNPWGVYDRIARVNILTTHYSQYRQYSINYYINIDTTKTYRFTQWVYTGRVAGTSDSQNNYYGIQHSTVCNLNTTTANTNPYFASPSMSTTQVMNKWALYVYYVYPYGSTGNPSNNQGFYYPDGTFASYGSNFNWNTGYTSTYIRQYLMYQYGEIAAGSHIMLYRPRIEIVDGTEEPLANLINGGEHRAISNDLDETVLNKTFNSNGVAIYTDYDEVTGTANPLAQHEIKNTGKLSINGDISEVD